MKSKKVRPMLDKELRDEVVSYLGGAGSFNKALSWLIKGHKQLIAESKEQAKERKSRSEMESELIFTKLELQANKSHSRMLMAENQALKNQLKQEIAKLHDEKVKDDKWSDDVMKHNSSLMDEIASDRWRSIERARLSLYRGAAIGLIIGLAIGHIFL